MYARPPGAGLAAGTRDVAARAEIGDLDLAVAADDEVGVGRLHVVMHDVESVQVAQVVEHAPRDARNGMLRDAAAPSEHIVDQPLD